MEGSIGEPICAIGASSVSDSRPFTYDPRFDGMIGLTVERRGQPDTSLPTLGILPLPGRAHHRGHVRLERPPVPVGVKRVLAGTQ